MTAESRTLSLHRKVGLSSPLEHAAQIVSGLYALLPQQPEGTGAAGATAAVDPHRLPDLQAQGFGAAQRKSTQRDIFRTRNSG